MPDAPLDALAAQVLKACRASGLTIGTVESCTGGLIAGALTEIAGSSDVVMGGMITYSNALKISLAGVSSELIATHGAVSASVACAMAEGGCARLGVDLCIAVTGVAGPGGGSGLKPVGLVYVALAFVAGETIIKELRLGDIGRKAVREKTVLAALNTLLAAFAATTPQL